MVMKQKKERIMDMETQLRLDMRKREEKYNDCMPSGVFYTAYCAMYKSERCPMVCDYAKRGGKD